jgi:hypothetical protein
VRKVINLWAEILGKEILFLAQGRFRLYVLGQSSDPLGRNITPVDTRFRPREAPPYRPYLC